ncbi:hypothetical protein AB4853_11520 [Bradyrhizobium sp. 1050_B9_N1_2]|uniref:hypothetical protein n=1 Tax=Bradyrhizobium sp. 1050_B9_N1_2 TaxID=3238688 RepID=UPI003EDBC7C7
MGKELMQDLEDLQKVEDSFRHGETTRKEYRSVESAVIRKAISPGKPAAGKKR